MSPRNHNLCLFLSFFVLATIVVCDLTEARHVTRWKHSEHPAANDTAPSPSQSPSYGPPEPYSGNAFNIRSYGAAGDGMTDDSEALLSAWKAACSVESAIIEIPSAFMFLIGPVTLRGPCKPNLVLQIDGVILGPSNIGSWPRSELLQWINLNSLQDFTIRGNGIVNGRGSAWWRRSSGTKPTAIRFYGSHNIVVQDITIQNSPQCHLKFDSSSGILVSKITITSPENSPNTDGIHLQNTNNVEITDCKIACGDDCISMQTGCSDVHIHGIECGPGHGISIGSLGLGGTTACVSNITVEDSSIHNTLTGVRIKTWAGGSGRLREVIFSGISVSNVDTPIVIDQFYCDGGSCPNEGKAVTISSVTFSSITGTYAVQPIYVSCSRDQPCTGLKFTGIELSPRRADPLVSHSAAMPMASQSLLACRRATSIRSPLIHRSTINARPKTTRRLNG